jgi:hypothetical protein
METVKFRPGQWMVRVVRGGPMVCARIWACNHDPNEPTNVMDRPYWQGQIGLDLVPPETIWTMLEFCEATPDKKKLLASPPLSERLPRNNRAPAFKTAPMPKWQQVRARRITLVEYLAELEWQSWAKINAPTHHDFTYRRPLDLRTAQVPRFT